jgi:cell shape-determining protein MreC
MMAINSRRQRGRGLSLRTVLLSVFFVIIALVVLVWRMPTQGAVWRILSPVHAAANSIGRNIGGIFTSKNSLVAENTALKEQLAALQAKDADRDELYRENILLKAQFGRSDVTSSSSILAAVLSAPPAQAFDTLVIDLGSQARIEPGDLVSVGEGAYIGEIQDVASHSARVTLFSSSGEVKQGLLNGKIPVTLYGDGEGALSTHVPANTAVLPGDSITLQNIAAGVEAIVVSVHSQEADSFKDVYLQLPANISELQYVIVHRK